MLVTWVRARWVRLVLGEGQQGVVEAVVDDEWKRGRNLHNGDGGGRLVLCVCNLAVDSPGFCLPGAESAAFLSVFSRRVTSRSLAVVCRGKVSMNPVLYSASKNNINSDATFEFLRHSFEPSGFFSSCRMGRGCGEDSSEGWS